VTANVEIIGATVDDRTAIRHLVELYAHDFSEFTDSDVDDNGEFGYPDLDRYWTETDRHPFLIRSTGRIAGFALVRSGAPHDMAEFFIMRKYRRHGVGVQAARLVFVRFPGDWQVRQLSANLPASAFWRVAIPVPFREDANDDGPVQRFHMPAPGEP
jgi:predicted acetyltransferase